MTNVRSFHSLRALQQGIVERVREDLAPRPVRKAKRPKRLPRAHKAIAWGKPHRAVAEGVFASMDRMCVGTPHRRSRYTFRDVCVIVCLILVLALTAAAGAALSHRGSDGRTDLQNSQL